ncbi:MAG: hypothetical protein HEEMFOPI_01594 [Holosporales bacterium]
MEKLLHKMLLSFILVSYSLTSFAHETLHTSDENYFLTAKIWGFLKYYHPSISKGKINPDLLLLEMLKEEDEGNQSLDSVISKAIQILKSEEDVVCLNRNHNNEIIAAQNESFNFLNSPSLSSSTRKALKIILKCHIPTTHTLVTQIEGHVVNHDNDNLFYDQRDSWKDKYIRMISLFRGWNIINYYHPSKNIISENWDGVLKDMIPYFKNAKSEKEYVDAVFRFNSFLNDTHSALSSPLDDQILGNFMLPIKLVFIGNKVVVSQVYNPNSQLLPGDIITKINGKTIDEMREEKKIYISASNDSSFKRDLATLLIRMVTNAEVELKVERDFNHYTIKENPIDRVTYHGGTSALSASVRPWKIIKSAKIGDIGYTTLAALKDEDVDKMFDDFANTKGLVIDVRNYPSGMILFRLYEHLYREYVNTVKLTCGSVQFPGNIVYQNSSFQELLNFKTPYDQKVVFLMNEETQSYAEFTILNLSQNGHGIKVGSQTAGADGDVVSIYFPGGINTYFSSLGVFYPNGKQTQRIGIVPDLEVHPTIEGIKKGRDEVLEAAINYLERHNN